MQLKDLALLIYPISLLIVMFRGAGLSPRGKAAPGFLHPDQTGMIRAAACLCVVLHHVTQYVTGYGTVPHGPVTVFNYAGFLFTGVFFFFSGYGLLTSLYTKEDYLRTFPRKRFPSVLIPFWTVNLLIVLFSRFLYGTRYTAAGFLSGVFGLTLVNGNGWFFVEITLFYLLFYLLFRWIRHRDAALLLLCAVVTGVILCSFRLGHDAPGAVRHWFRGEWWYNSTSVFLLGLLAARFRERLSAFLEKHFAPALCVAAVLFAFSFPFSVWVLNRFGYYIDVPFGGRRAAAFTLLAQTAAALSFTALVVLLNRKITLHSRILARLSGITPELFLLHGVFVSPVFDGVRMPVFWRYAAVLACGTGAAALTAPPVNRLIRLVSGFSHWRRPDHHTLESEMARRKKKARLRVLRAALIAAVPAALILLWITSLRRIVFAAADFSREREAIRSAAVGDEVLFGWYETGGWRPGPERLSWIVVKREGDVVSLICRDGIAGSSFHHRHEAVSWEDSDLRALLNSDKFTSIFSRYERSAIVPVEGDLLTLMTPDEARELFESDEARELGITSAAERQGTNVNRLSKDHYWDMKGYRSSWWWLRNPRGEKSITAPIVTVDGVIDGDLKAVNKPGGAVRPFLRVDTGG